MVELIRNYNFTDVNTKSGMRSRVGCVFDWFEVRVHELPNIEVLQKYGYSPELDKGCATHLHYFDTEDFSVSWDIRSSYIEKGWSHFRVKNHKFYGISGYNTIVEYVQIMCRTIFSQDCEPVIVRVDFAFDMSIKSDLFRHLRAKFRTHQLGTKEKGFVDKYTQFVGKVGNYEYVNYSAGARSAKMFYRLYNKTVENTDYQTKQPKKEYIAEWHKKLFVDDYVYRFEIEHKPVNTLLSSYLYNQFKYFAEVFFNDNFIELYLGENYINNIGEFSIKDACKIKSLLSKFLRVYPSTKSKCLYSTVIDNMDLIIDGKQKLIID